MNIGKTLPVDITAEMRKSYLDYAMSVIVARALPDVRDGLKPVHRRILYAMHEMGLAPGSPYTKSAKVVGETMGKYHPHGDGPIYDALVRMAQDFSMRYPLVDGQGNFGSTDGDPPAAMRYTEVRPAKISQELLLDINKDTVEFEPNFDDSLKEPKYLPALLPNLLLMGAEGIAVGMATKIPPHNLTEVIQAIIATIQKGKVIQPETLASIKDTKKEKSADFFIKKIDLAISQNKIQENQIKAPEVDFNSDITIEEIMKFIKGPDFPTGGVIYDAKHFHEVYAAGRGRIIARGVASIEESTREKTKIIITELPYQVNKATLVAKIAELVKDKKIVGVADIRDESDRRGMSVVIELKKDSRPKAILNNLYKHTDLQSSFPANFVALVDGIPRTLNIKQILVEYIKHRQKVVTRRSLFELTEAKRRAHILEGLKIALDNLDEVIQVIRKSRDAETAKKNLMETFGLTDIQATAILDMQLRKLSALERAKIEEEYKKVGQVIDHLTDLLLHPEKILKVIQKEIEELKEKYGVGDPRKTKVFTNPVGEMSEEDLVAQEETIITVTKTGYIKRVPPSTYRAQRRGGKGVVGMTTKEEDKIAQIISATTHDTLMLFTNKGRVFGIRVWEIPESSRIAKGQAAVNLINTEQEERIEAVLALGGKDNAKFLALTTTNGIIKRTRLEKFKNLKNKGLIAIKLEKSDSLAWVKPTDGESHIILVTKKGKCIRFSEEDARPLGRPTRGVRGITLGSGDEVIGMEVVPAKPQEVKDKRRKMFRNIFVVTERGLGKRTPIQLFPIQKRAGAGVKVAELNEKTGDVAAALLATQEVEQVIITSRTGQIIKLPIKNIPQLGRATQGVILMRFTNRSDGVAAVTTLEKDGEEEGETSNNSQVK